MPAATAPSEVGLATPVVLGIDHYAAPLAIRERLAAAVADLPRVIAHLRAHTDEAAVLSTCNRTEIYFVGGDAARAVDCLSGAADVPRDALEEFLSLQVGAAAARHLFAVTCGLESQLLGETQILGQVREAHEACRAAGGIGPILGGLFGHALALGRRARAQTGISRGAASVGSAAAEIVRREVSPPPRHLVVIGVGEAAERVIVHLKSLRIARLDVANRTLARAEHLVTPPGRARPLEDLRSFLAEADVVVSATGSPGAIIRAADVEAALERRQGRALTLIDLAVPRDVEPAAGRLTGVRLFDVDEVQARAATTVRRREDEVAAVQRLVDAQVELFERWLIARRAAPAIARLRGAVEAARLAEVERATAGMSERERAAVARATRALARKLLHGPTIALRNGTAPDVAELLGEALERRP